MDNRKQPRETVETLCKERYADAKAIFWAGSVATGSYTGRSDLDIVVIYEQLPNASREAFIYDNWKIDAFIHDPETLHYFMDESRRTSGISGTVQMVLYGIEITPSSSFSKAILDTAQAILDAGPLPWSINEINKERFLITDSLDDILSPQNRAEQIASASWLYEALAQFYFRAQGKWCASGKSILRYLKKQDYELACNYRDAFEDVFKHGHTGELEQLVKKILVPYGGFLWEGYRSDAPVAYKLPLEKR